MGGSLEILTKRRKDLLLAEAAAWLHDMGKCTDAFIQNENARGFKSSRKKEVHLNPHKAIFSPTELDKFTFSSGYEIVRKEEAEHQFALHRLVNAKILSQLDQQIQINEVPYTIRELVYFSRPGMIGRTSGPLGKEGIPVEYLGRCHAAAHVEKEEPDVDNNLFQQPANDIRPSSPFGFEGLPLKDLTKKLESLPYDKLTEWKDFKDAVQLGFGSALGDTRRPINEVTLWDWAHIVGALYKAALAGALLKQQETRIIPKPAEIIPKPNELKWRFLALRFDGRQVVDRSPNIQALLARRDWVKEGLDKAKDLLEEHYPLGTEVYRDSNGSLFVVPDIDDLLDYTADGGQTLRLLIHQQLDSVFAGELVITPQLDKDAWWGQDPGRQGNDKVPPIDWWLGKKEPANPDLGKAKNWWQNANAEPCRISGIRPQGPDPKAIDRKLSNFWWKRIGKRAKRWLKEPGSTIWMSEVADSNGRVALVAARLELEHWLRPDGLVNTLLVTRPQQGGSGGSNSVKRKTPSFARLRRVWETCTRFWEESANAEALSSLVGVIGPRLIIQGSLSNTLSLRPYHAYEIPIKTGILMEVVWDGQRLIVITNLQYLAKRLGAQPDHRHTPDLAAEWLRQKIQEKKQLKLYEPDASGNEQELVCDVHDITVNLENHNYIPAIRVLSEPAQFMILVPANKALEIAQHLKSEYELQFSKVKNRLPIHLNLLFFGRKQPFYAVLDAVRRMLNRNSPLDTAWVVKSVGQPAEITRHTERLGNQTIKLNLHRINNSQLPQLNDNLETLISYGTGVPMIEDDWYPYFFVRSLNPGIPDEKRQLIFKATLPGKGETTMIHIKEIKEGDEIYYAPSTFDFEFLDVTARRFELVYDEASGLRRPCTYEQYSTRPFLLEDLDIMRDLWEVVAMNPVTRRSSTQLRHITELVEAKRLEWQVSLPDDDVLATFAEQVFRRSLGKLWNEISEVRRSRLVSWISSGRWRDLMELYTSVLKLSPGEGYNDKKEEEVVS